MRELFQAELSGLGDQLSEIATLVRAAMTDAKSCLENTDLETAERVITEDARIDFLQNALDEKAIELLALQAPVATDLRTVVAALRMSSSLERMGDLARHIAQLTRLRYPDHVIPESARERFASMAALAVEAAEETEALLSTHDLRHASAVAQINRQINEIHAANFKAVAAEDWTAGAATTADVTLASRYLERFSDHAVSVSRKVTYLVTGEWEPDVTAV